MKMDRQKRIAAALERLFRTYQQPGGGEEALRDRMERAKVYFEAVVPYDIADIEQAVANLLSGSAPGVNPSFQPPAPAVGAECRRCMNLRLESEHRDRTFRPRLPPPDVVKSPESRERVRAMADELIANIAERNLTDAAAIAHRRAERDRNSAKRWEPDMSDEATRRRLGFDVGDADGAEDAA